MQLVAKYFRRNAGEDARRFSLKGRPGGGRRQSGPEYTRNYSNFAPGYNGALTSGFPREDLRASTRLDLGIFQAPGGLRPVSCSPSRNNNPMRHEMTFLDRISWVGEGGEARRREVGGGDNKLVNGITLAIIPIFFK